MGAEHMENRYFKSRYSFDKSRAKVWRAICEYLQQFVDVQGAILDLGAGYCDFINNIIAECKIAVDCNKESEKYCNENARFYCSPVTSLEFIQDHTIDAVFMSNLLEHLENDQLGKTFQEIARVIKAHGRLIILQPNYRYCFKEYFDDYTHVKAYSHISLCDFLNSIGYNIIRVEKRFLPFSFKSRLPASYYLTKLYLAVPWKPFAKQMLIVAEKR